jgi:hypothetical protein
MYIRVLSLIAVLASAQFVWSLAINDRDRTCLSSQRESVTIRRFVGLRKAARTIARAVERQSDFMVLAGYQAPTDHIAGLTVAASDGPRAPRSLSDSSACCAANKTASSHLAKKGS